MKSVTTKSILNKNQNSLKNLYFIEFLLLISFLVLTTPSNNTAQLVAFPGAEGYGRLTTGGRGGVVYEVTNLNDSGAGSLRDAIGKTGQRTIVFMVSGTIELKSDLKISKGDLTIAGQTAPGDGICLRNYTLSVQANNVIIRFIRSRYGDTIITNEDDAAHGMGKYKNIIIDHCSFSWSVDETASFYDNTDFTMQWCLISESLFLAGHVKGAHGYGGIWGGQGATFHHNLLAHHTSRNPRFNGSRYSGQPDKEIVDFVNNVIYNWGFKSAYGGEGGNQNVRSNYYKYGPATKSGVKYRIVEPSDSSSNWYVKDNFVFGSNTITNDNWNGGVQGTYASYQKNKKALTPFLIASVTVQLAEEAYHLVMNNVGANFPKRDPIDSRIINEVKTGTATYSGRAYAKDQNLDTTKIYGIIDSQNEVGGWPILNSLPAPEDFDHDGMPDDWELANGLNPNDPNDRNGTNADGYTMLEVYLNSLVPDLVTSVERESSIPTDFQLFANYPNPFNPETTIQYKIPNTGNVEIIIFDINGREVFQLFKGFQEAGLHKISWNGISENDKKVASGVYFCMVSYNKFSKSLKLIFLK